MWKGSLKNVDNGFMIVLGSGIGGTYILHEKIVESKHYKIGELGSFLIPTSNGYSNFGKNIMLLNSFMI